MMRPATTSRPARLAGWLLGLVAVLALLTAPAPTMPGAAPAAAMAMASGHMAMAGAETPDHRGECCDAIGHGAGLHCAACLIAVEAEIAPTADPASDTQHYRLAASPGFPPGGPGLPPKPPRLA